MPLCALAVLSEACSAPFAVVQRWFVQEEVCSEQGSGWSEETLLDCSSPVVPAGLGCRAASSSPCKPRLAELDLQLCCASAICGKGFLGMVGI